MKRYLKKFNTHKEYLEYIADPTHVRPNVSLCDNNEQVHYEDVQIDYYKQYLTTTALEDGSITFVIPVDVTFQQVSQIAYSTDNGETWETIPNVQPKEEDKIIEVEVEEGDAVLWKGFGSSLALADDGCHFAGDVNFDVTGNINSMLYSDNFEILTNNYSSHAFHGLFKDSNVVNAKGLYLPDKLGAFCYASLFEDCALLQTPPQLSATTLAEGCYSSMFRHCTSLKKAPELPATTLANACYSSMFDGCTSLKKVPNLPAATLAEWCYSNMFENCTSITTTHAFPTDYAWTSTAPAHSFDAMYKGCTALVNIPERISYDCEEYCYHEMFMNCTALERTTFVNTSHFATSCCESMYSGCTSLTKITQIFYSQAMAYACYSNMFEYCTALEKAPEILPATTLEPYCYSNMFHYCTSLKNAPELPATTLTEACYRGMFHECTSLQAAPQLPATTLARNCYTSMFNNCQKLTKAPEVLPATELVNQCYQYMFASCYELEKAPILPATKLVSQCYAYMFRTCKKLKWIKAEFLTQSVNYTRDWVLDVADRGTFIQNADATWRAYNQNAIPEGWQLEREESDSQYTYLTTKALGDGVISFNIDASIGRDYIYSIYYSTNNGNTWTETVNVDDKSENLVISVNVTDGQKVMWKGLANSLSGLVNSQVMRSNFSSNVNFDVMGNPMSMLYLDDFIGQDTLEHEYSLSGLFYNNSYLVNAKDLALPATTLSNDCYFLMFYHCTSLLTAPELPATTLANHCYNRMFEGCTALQTAPELPATKLANNCYSFMFKDCTALQTAPEILPATTMKYYCYMNMFKGCTLLEKAPQLPAITLVIKCYYEMFKDCTSLNYVYAMFTNNPSSTSDLTSYCVDWLDGVANSGTFVKNANATWDNVYAVPTGWTVETE